MTSRTPPNKIGSFICAGLILASVFFVIRHLWLLESHYEKCYQQIADGMTVGDVEAILGVGTVLKQSEVTTIAVAVNQADADAALENARKRGDAFHTVRNYPIRHKPVVEGDYILQWVDSSTGEIILVAFKQGMLHEKYYHNPNYL